MAIQVAIDDGRKDKSKDYSYLSDTQLPELSVEEEAGIIKRLDLRKDLAQMPLRYQQCVLMIERGLKKKQIAEQLGIRSSAVSEILRNVKTQLYPTYYPAAHSLERQISIFYQGYDELCRGVEDGMHLLYDLRMSNPVRSLQYESQQLAEKTEMGLIKCRDTLINIQAKLGKRNKGDVVRGIIEKIKSDKELLTNRSLLKPPHDAISNLRYSMGIQLVTEVKGWVAI